MTPLIAIAALALASPPPVAPPAQPPAQIGPVQAWAFDDAASLEGWDLSATGDAAKRMPKPKIEGGKFYLLESWSNSTCVAAAPVLPEGERAAAWVEFRFTLVMNTGTEGMGLAWLDTSAHGAEPRIPAEPKEAFGPGVNAQAITLEPWGWEAPNFARGFGVGFDASDAPNRDPFKGSGNNYDRPQREVSLHWDGMEVVKRVANVEFRDEKPHQVRVRVDFVTGGAMAGVWIDGDAVFERAFVAGMTPFAGRAVLGARNGATAGDVLIDDLTIARGPAVEAPAPPLRVTGLDHVLNDKDHGNNEARVEFPADTSAYGRIICTLRLDKPEKRFDPWDRAAHVNIVDDSGEVFELIRYITPYHRGHEWKVDVSDFRPLLTGKKKIVQACGTQGEGWVVSMWFDYYPRAAGGGSGDSGGDAPCAIKMVNLWSGGPEIGNPDKPVEAFYAPRTVPVPQGATGARVRSVVSGHGMSPNTNNAGEFMSIARTLKVNGESWVNTLWKSDNYLNPCRPQGGTWKYDRAGWAPGDIVRPWEVDVSTSERKELRIEYILDAYVNEGRGKTWAPTHRTEAQVVFYGERK